MAENLVHTLVRDFQLCSHLENTYRMYIVITIIVYVDSMMNEDIVKKTSRLCLRLVVNSVVREF